LTIRDSKPGRCKKCVFFLLFEDENLSHVVPEDRKIDSKKSKVTGNALSQKEEEKSKNGTDSIPKKKEFHIDLKKTMEYYN
jgi:hypothetical protein